jgi:spoIIIJ-associated protein
MIMGETNEQTDDAWEEKDPNDAPLPKADADAGSEAEGERAGRRRRREPDLEPSDDRQRKALEFLGNVVREMEMDCTVHLRRAREGNSVDEINLEIAGRDAGRIIGKKGQVLSALQFVTHRVINRPGLDRRHVSVDAEGYKSRRDDSLASMARRLGKQAVEQGKIITFEPMNPRDRRVVHLALAGFEGVITRSDGEGDDRRVQIIPVRRAGSAGNAPSPA